MKKTRYNYRDNFEEVIIRMTEFKKEGVTVSSDHIKHYTTMTYKIASAVYSKNYGLFYKVGFHVADVHNILNTCVFLFLRTSKYGKMSEEESKVLYSYLRQRTSYIIKVCKRKAKGIIESPSYHATDIEEANITAESNSDIFEGIT